ncbi:15450_t:CDS:2 [Cetraspora pellucida]|uniref:15450_t:CDS:1 n=1 Tax=Cetraspora pellucida TaxID=1433469 RepID=A0ACA9MSJ2_9GLOM|nr:15450_t:CDS:2 [Cetraspora pellucida]
MYRTFSPPLHNSSTTNSGTTNGPYYLHPNTPSINDHPQSHQQQMASQTLQQSNSMAAANPQWSSPDKQRLNSQIFSPGSTNMPFGSGYPPTNGSNDKTKVQRPMMDVPNISSLSSFGVQQSPNGPPALPPPQNQPVQHVDISSNVSNMSAGRNQSRTLTNSKRAAQNRAAQRAFRQRKDRYIKDLEAKAKSLDTIKKQFDALLKEKQEMAQIIRNLRSELAKYKGEELSDDEGRQSFGGNNNSASSNSTYSHYGNSTRDDDSQGLGEEPWLRHKDGRKESSSTSMFNMNDERSGLILPPGPNTDSSVDPYFRPDYRSTNSHSSPSPPSSSADRNIRGSYNNNSGRPGYSSNEEDTDRVYDDLCELLKTRTRPALPHNLNVNVWSSSHPHSPNQTSVVATNGSGTVVG